MLLSGDPPPESEAKETPAASRRSSRRTSCTTMRKREPSCRPSCESVAQYRSAYSLNMWAGERALRIGRRLLHLVLWFRSDAPSHSCRGTFIPRSARLACVWHE